MTRPATVLALAFTDLARDPRVRRQIRFLAGSYRVVAAGTGDPPPEAASHVRLDMSAKGPLGKAASLIQLVTRGYEAYYSRFGHVRDARRKLSRLDFDLVIANDLETLPVALEVAGKSRPVLFDAHEYAPEVFADSRAWRFLFRPYLEHLARTRVPAARAMVTACEGYARAWETLTGVRPEVVTNAIEYIEIQPRTDADPRSPIALVHHGNALENRRIEWMIEAMDELPDRFTLDLVLMPHPSAPTYLARLRRFAASRPAGGRVRFLDPVPLDRIGSVLSAYDVGVYIMAPTNYNNLHGLPNKLFEYVQARLAVAIAPSPEMAAVVRAHDLGVVADDFTPGALARALSGLDRARVNEYKRKVHAAARALSAEPNRKKMLEIVSRLLPGSPPCA